METPHSPVIRSRQPSASSTLSFRRRKIVPAKGDSVAKSLSVQIVEPTKAEQLAVPRQPQILRSSVVAETEPTQATGHSRSSSRSDGRTSPRGVLEGMLDMLLHQFGKGAGGGNSSSNESRTSRSSTPTLSSPRPEKVDPEQIVRLAPSGDKRRSEPGPRRLGRVKNWIRNRAEPTDIDDLPETQQSATQFDLDSAEDDNGASGCVGNSKDSNYGDAGTDADDASNYKSPRRQWELPHQRPEPLADPTDSATSNGLDSTSTTGLDSASIPPQRRMDSSGLTLSIMSSYGTTDSLSVGRSETERTSSQLDATEGVGTLSLARTSCAGIKIRILRPEEASQRSDTQSNSSRVGSNSIETEDLYSFSIEAPSTSSDDTTRSETPFPTSAAVDSAAGVAKSATAAAASTSLAVASGRKNPLLALDSVYMSEAAEAVEDLQPSVSKANEPSDTRPSVPKARSGSEAYDHLYPPIESLDPLSLARIATQPEHHGVHMSPRGTILTVPIPPSYPPSQDVHDGRRNHASPGSPLTDSYPTPSSMRKVSFPSMFGNVLRFSSRVFHPTEHADRDDFGNSATMPRTRTVSNSAALHAATPVSIPGRCDALPVSPGDRLFVLPPVVRRHSTDDIPEGYAGVSLSKSCPDGFVSSSGSPFRGNLSPLQPSFPAGSGLLQPPRTGSEGGVPLSHRRSRSMGSNLSTLGREGYRRNTGFGRKIVETSVIYAKIEAPSVFPPQEIRGLLSPNLPSTPSPSLNNLSTISASSPISSPSSTQAEAPESTQGRVNQYHIYREIGSGAYGRVMLCRSEEDSRFYACKIISKLRLRKKFRWQGGGLGGCSTPGGTVQQDAALATVRQEIAILKKISKHNNINGLVEVLDDQKEDNLYLIFDLCEYGPIMHMAVNSRVRPFAENLARELFRDVVLGLEYLHFLKIIHRDLKPENLLLRADMTLQISDFGISYMCMDSGGGDDEEDVVLDQKNASPLFTSPEACMPETREISGKAVDIWSLGVTLFCFVHGYCPWEDDNVLQLYGKIVNDPPVISSHYCSKDLQDLLTQMLQKDPGARITLKEIRDHPWVTKSGDLPMMTTEENCQFDPVTEEEIENAVNPSVTFVTKIMNKLRGKRNSNGQVLSESQGRLPQKQKSFHHSTPVMSQRGGTLGRNGLLPSGAHFSNSSIQISPSVESLTSANGNSTGGFGSLWKRRAKSYNPGGSGSGAGSAGCGSLPSSRPITPLPVLPPPLAIPPVTTQPSIPLLVPMSPKSSGGRENAGMPYLRGMSSFSTSSRRLGEIQPVVTERNGSEYGTPKRTDSQRDNRMGLEDGGHMVPEPAQDRENGGGQRSGSLISLP